VLGACIGAVLLLVLPEEAVAGVAWAPAALIGAGASVGGQVGATYGRRLSPGALRGLIVLVGAAAIVKLLTE